MHKFNKENIKWKEIKSSSGFHNAILFLIFVAVSAVFWFILALNDSAQDNFNIKINITNLPDSVTFISDIPDRIHASVRDKGTSLWRNGVLKKPAINIDFKEFSSDGVLRFTQSDMNAALKGIFGPDAQINDVSIDSLKLEYTVNPGKSVPVEVLSRILPALGSTMENPPRAYPSSVMIYGDLRKLDTIQSVVTDFIELRDISESKKTKIDLKKIPGVRIIPNQVEIDVEIEPLVKKETLITVTTVNVPEGEDLLLFPSKVPVAYYVAMSRLNDNDDPNIELEVDYNQLDSVKSGKLHVELIKYPDRLKNLTLVSDSVEYAIVKN